MSYTGAPSFASPAVAYNAQAGRTLVYVANNDGDMLAFDASSGGLLWSTHLGPATESSPLVDGNLVWEGTPSGIFALDAATGSLVCKDVSIPGPVISSPTQGNVNGQDLVFFTTLDHGANWGAMIALDSSCGVKWSFNGWGSTPGQGTPLGSWSPPSFGTDVKGDPLVFTGTAEPDSAVYAINAATGTLVWRFLPPSNGVVDDDIGAGTTVSPPGANGIADGVLYVPSKNGDLYALDLTTGQELWAFPYAKDSKTKGGGISTAALDGSNLYMGYGAGVYDVNAVTGAPVWKTQDFGLTTGEVDASPAIAGPAGNQIVVAADRLGVVRGFAASSGHQLWSYQTSGAVYSSPAISGGEVYITSNDGFLYAFKPGGSTGAHPTTSVSYPSIGAQLSNPNGVITITGSATGSQPLSSVLVGIQEYGQGGPWWQASTHSWSASAVFQPATLASPNADSSGWQFAFAVPPSGGVYVLDVDAVQSNGLADPLPPHVPFAVFATTTGPQLSINPSSVSPAGTLVATGVQFAPSTEVSIALDGTPLFTRTTDSNGNLTQFSVKVPSTEMPGPHSLWGTDGAGDDTQAIVNVSSPWPEWRFTPAGTGAVRHTQPLNEGNLWTVRNAWSVATGGAVESSPAVFNGTAYIGSDDDRLYALNITNGAVRWTVSTGGQVKSAPAVVGGSVVFGSEDGVLRAVDVHSGVLQWESNLGTPLDSSPVISGSTVFIGGADGLVRALDLSNHGALLWSTQTGGSLTASGAVDQGRLFIGSHDGYMYALDVSTGAVDWKQATGAAITSTAAVDSGTVFVGSGDAKVYALNESTGAVLWTYTTAGAVASSPAVGGGMVFFGSNDGTFYAVNETTGALVWSVPTGGAISSSPVFAGGFVAVGSTSGKLYAVRAGYGWPKSTYVAGGAVTSSISISDGAMYVGAGSEVQAYTLYGAPPIIP